MLYTLLIYLSAPYHPSHLNHLKDDMGFKNMDHSFGFTDLALASSVKHNRSLKLIEKIDKAIDWSRVKVILLNHYNARTSGERADAYPPMLSLKCISLQKWFRINSDPELENQIHPVKSKSIQFFKALKLNGCDDSKYPESYSSIEKVSS